MYSHEGHTSFTRESDGLRAERAVKQSQRYTYTQGAVYNRLKLIVDTISLMSKPTVGSVSPAR